jgi:hypothetical protein
LPENTRLCQRLTETRRQLRRCAAMLLPRAERHRGSVTASTAGRRRGRQALDGWATKQRPACRGGTDMTTKHLADKLPQNGR